MNFSPKLGGLSAERGTTLLLLRREQVPDTIPYSPPVTLFERVPSLHNLPRQLVPQEF